MAADTDDGTADGTDGEAPSGVLVSGEDARPGDGGTSGVPAVPPGPAAGRPATESRGGRADPGTGDELASPPDAAASGADPRPSSDSRHNDDTSPDDTPDGDTSPNDTPHDDSTPGAAAGHAEDSAGRPWVRVDAFRLGFVGALGVFAAIAVVQALTSAGQVVTLVFTALFLALGLDPLISRLERWGLGRGAAVAVTFLGLVALVTALVATIIPVVVDQATELGRQVPRYIDQIERLDVIQDLDEQYGLFERVNTELEARLTSGDTVQAVFGGVLGAGRAVVTGAFSVVTVLILTLYFLVSLRPMTRALYRLVPATRRPRVESIAGEAQRRVGGYVLGQLAIASLNGALSFVVMLILDVEFAVALAFAVAVLGLIPLVGATLGAVLVALVTTVAAFGSAPPDAGLLSILGDTIVLVIWFIVYQQIENYVIAPRIFARSVAVPGTAAVVAALIGGSLLGLLGALVAVPVAAVILLVIDEVVVPMQERR